MYFDFEDVKVYYKVLKNDNSSLPPVLFLHGWGGGVSSFIYFAERLQIYRTCILLSFPPFENSTEPLSPWDLPKYAKMTASLMAHLGQTSCDIVAHSFGGRVAIELASSGTLQIRKLVLTASAGIKTRSIKRNIKVAIYKAKKFLSKLHLYSAKRLFRQGSSDYKNLSPTMKKTFSNIVCNNQRKMIKNIKCPTLLFWGEKDKDTPFYFTNVFKKHINNCGVIKVSGGHFAYIEHAKLFLSVLISFMKE